jgi:hypothetical protein
MLNVFLIPCLSIFVCFADMSKPDAEKEQKPDPEHNMFVPAVIYFDNEKFEIPCPPEVVSDKSEPQANLEQIFVIKG